MRRLERSLRDFVENDENSLVSPAKAIEEVILNLFQEHLPVSKYLSDLFASDHSSTDEL